MSSGAEDEPPKTTDRAAWLERRSVVLVVAVAIAGLVVLAQKWSRTEQAAGNWINGISVLVAGLNVLLTFYILRTAQKQLGILRDDLKNARLELQNQAHQLELARADAQRAHAETAKTRLDLIAPRCSIELTTAKVHIRKRGDQEPRVVHGDEEISGRDIDDVFIEVSFILTATNWGAEPIMYSTGHPIEPTGNFVLKPQGKNSMKLSFRHSARDWMTIVKGEADLWLRPPSNPQFSGVGFDVRIPVTSLNLEVNDEHRLRLSIMPIEVKELLGLSIHDGARVLFGCQRVATIQRDYPSLGRPSSTSPRENS